MEMIQRYYLIALSLIFLVIFFEWWVLAVYGVLYFVLGMVLLALAGFFSYSLARDVDESEDQFCEFDD